MAAESHDTLQPVTIEAIDEVRALLAEADSGALATLEPKTGQPMVSRAGLATLNSKRTPSMRCAVAAGWALLSFLFCFLNRNTKRLRLQQSMLGGWKLDPKAVIAFPRYLEPSATLRVSNPHAKILRRNLLVFGTNEQNRKPTHSRSASVSEDFCHLRTTR